MQNSSLIKLNIEKLTADIEIIKNKTANLKVLLQPCIHGVKYAQKRPYLCEQCALEYIENCDRLELVYDFNVYFGWITRRDEIKKQQELEKAQRIFDYKQGKYDSKLSNYENKRDLTNKEIGKRYERYIGYVYEWVYTENGGCYEVEYHGILKGVEDGGIDLIIKKGKNEIILIQCKWWNKEKIMFDDVVRSTIGAREIYKTDNPNKKVIAKIVSGNDNLKEKNKDICEKNGVIYEVVPYDNDYPKIKCNINSRGRIYHLPDDPAYDRIKIERHRGEYYVATETEALRLGFRREIATKPKQPF